MERLVRSQMLRLSLASAIIAIGIWSFLPYLAHRVAASAYVIVEILRVTAPIAGEVGAQPAAQGGLYGVPRPRSIG